MHICIPDTREVKPQHGSAYLLYNIHIDGLYHCSLRYKQLLHLHQLLTKRFNNDQSYQLPQFPPKKLLPLSNGQIEERRMQLEKYLQYISQDKLISSSSIFNLFLLEAQRESTRIKEKHVHLDIELVNGQKIRLPILTHDSADDILQACCRALGLSDRYHAYFCLCLCGYDVVRDKLIIKRRLSFNEAPFITLQMAIEQQEQLQSVLSSSSSSVRALTSFPPQAEASNSTQGDCHCLSCSQQQRPSATGVPLVGSSSTASSETSTSNLFMNTNDSRVSHYNNNRQCNWQQQLVNVDHYNGLQQNNNNRSFVTHRILLRKSYWDPIYDTYILNDQQALNLLFIQTVYDMKHSLMFVDRETYHQLETLLAQDLKLEYILLAQTLKYYNYVHFEPCYSDYPRPRTKVMISIGSKELNMRVLKTPTPRPIQSPASSSSGCFGPVSSNETGIKATKQPSNNNDGPVLYCTSSLVPSGYRQLLTKEDIVEEEYNFKVPLIRCWRLTSLETLHSNLVNPSSSSTTAGKTSRFLSSCTTSAPVATTTLAGGKRKSLSLFNSIVGNSPPDRSLGANGVGVPPRSNRVSIGGADGVSLMAALTSNNTTNGSTAAFGNVNSSSSTLHRRRDLDNGSSSTTIATNSNPNNSQQRDHHQFCQHENQHCLQHDQPMSQYELSFKYLISKDTLKWITISSDQAIFISISLQGVVDELVSKREGASYAMQQQQQQQLMLLQQQQQQQQQLQRRTSSARHWPLYFNPSPPRSEQPTTQLIPPLYPSNQSNNGSTTNSGNSNGSLRQRQQQQPQAAPMVETFNYMQRDGTQRQLSGSIRPLFRDAAARSLLEQQQPVEFAQSRALNSSSSFWSQNSSSQQFVSNSNSGLFGSSSSRPTSSSTSSAVRRLSDGSTNGADGGSHHQDARLSMQKAPSPIINGAFEATTNGDDLL